MDLNDLLQQELDGTAPQQPATQPAAAPDAASSVSDDELDALLGTMRGVPPLTQLFPDVDPEELSALAEEAETGAPGFFETAFDLGMEDVPFLGDVASAYDLYDDFEAQEAWFEDKATPEQQRRVAEQFVRRARGTSMLGQAGELAAGAVTFGTEMAAVAATGGAALGAVAGKKATAKGIGTMARKASRDVLEKKVSQKLARTASKRLGQVAAVATRAAGVGLGVTAAKEAIPRLKYGVGAANATSFRRVFNELTESEARDLSTLVNEANADLLSGDAPMSWKGLAEVFMINSLEVAGAPAIRGVAGATLGKIPPAAYLSALSAKAIDRGLAKLPGKGRTFSRIQRFLRDRASFHGELEEVAEELLQNTITEETFGNDWRDGLPEDFEELAAMFVGFGALPTGALAAGTSVDAAVALQNRFRQQASMRRAQRKLPELPEGLSAELDETQQAPRDVTPEEYKRFVNTGDVDDSTVVAIADAIEQGNADARQEGEFGAGIERDPRIVAFMGDSAVSERVEAELARRAAQLKEEPQVEVEITNAARAFGDAVLQQEGAPVTLRSTPEAMPPEEDESDEAEQTRRRSFLGFAAVTLGQRLGRRVFFVDSDAPRRAGAARGAFDASTGTIFIDGTDADPLKTVIHEFFHSGMARVGKAEEGASQEVLDYLKGAFPEAYRSAEALYRSRNLQAEQMAPADLAEEIGATMAEELFDEIATVLRDPNSEQPFRQLLTRVIEEANDSPAARSFFGRMLEVLRDIATKLRLMPPRGVQRQLLAEVLETDPATAAEQARLIMDLVGLIEGTTSGSVSVFEDEAGRLRFAPPEEVRRDRMDEERAGMAMYDLQRTLADNEMRARGLLQENISQVERDLLEQVAQEGELRTTPGGGPLGVFPTVVFHGSNRPFGDMLNAFISQGEGTQWEGYGFYLASMPQAASFYANTYTDKARQEVGDAGLPELPVAITRIGSPRPELPYDQTLDRQREGGIEQPESAAPWRTDKELLQRIEQLGAFLGNASKRGFERFDTAKFLDEGFRRMRLIRMRLEEIDAPWTDPVIGDLFTDEDEAVDAMIRTLATPRTVKPMTLQDSTARQLLEEIKGIVGDVDQSELAFDERGQVTPSKLAMATIAMLYPPEVYLPAMFKQQLGSEDLRRLVHGNVYSDHRDTLVLQSGTFRDSVLAGLVSALANARRESNTPIPFSEIGADIEDLRMGSTRLIDVLRGNEGPTTTAVYIAPDLEVEFMHEDFVRNATAVREVAMTTRVIREGDLYLKSEAVAANVTGVRYAFRVTAPRTKFIQHDLSFDEQPTGELNELAKELATFMAVEQPRNLKLGDMRDYEDTRREIIRALRNQDKLEAEGTDVWELVQGLAGELEPNSKTADGVLAVYSVLGLRVTAFSTPQHRLWGQRVRAKAMQMGLRGFEYPGAGVEDDRGRNFVVFSPSDIQRIALASEGKEDAEQVSRRSVQVRVKPSAQLPAFGPLQRAASASGGTQNDAMALIAELTDGFINDVLADVQHEKITIPVLQTDAGGQTSTMAVSHLVLDDASAETVVERANRIGQGLGAETIHVLEPLPNVRQYDPLQMVDDDSFVTQAVTFSAPLDAPEFPAETLQLLANQFGIANLIFNPAADAETLRKVPELAQVASTITTYYAGDPSDRAAFERWQQQANDAANAIAREGAVSVAEGAYLLHNIGRQDAGAQIPYTPVSDALPITTRPNSAQSKRSLVHRSAEFLLNGLTSKTSANLTRFGGNSGVRWDAETQKARQKLVADYFERMALDDTANPLVTRAYTELQSELVKQWNTLPVRAFGKEGDGNVYNSSTDMRRDVRQNNRMEFALTMPGAYGPEGFESFEDSPLMRPALQEDGTRITDFEGRPLLYNDLLRVVHDYYAHVLTDNEFGELGEEGARRTHMAITTNAWASWALMTETYGNNSWVNFWGPNREKAVKDRPFAEQKVGLLPIQTLLLRTSLPSMGEELETKETLADRLQPIVDRSYSESVINDGQFIGLARLLNVFANPFSTSEWDAFRRTPQYGRLREELDPGNTADLASNLHSFLVRALALRDPQSVAPYAATKQRLVDNVLSSLLGFGNPFPNMSEIELSELREGFNYQLMEAPLSSAIAEALADQPLVELAATLRARVLAKLDEGGDSDPALGSFRYDRHRPIQGAVPRLRFAPYANGRARWDNGAMTDFDPYVMSSAFVNDKKSNTTPGKSRMDRRYIASMAGWRKAKAGPQKELAARYLRLTPIGRRFKGEDDDTVIKRVAGIMKKNALFLHDMFPQELRDEARQWYAGGFKLCTEIGDEFRLSTPSVAAAMACFSPQTEWMLNLSQTRMTADVYANDRATTLTEAELEWAYNYETGKKDPDERFPYRKYISALRGRTLQSFIDAARGDDSRKNPDWVAATIFVKTRAATKYVNEVPVYSPTGQSTGEVRRNNDGSARLGGFTALTRIADALAVFDAEGREDHRQQIDNSIGAENKVRSFYMNLLFPNDVAGDVTNDTHNIAALILQPVGGSADFVGQGLSGSKGSYDEKPEVRAFWDPHGGKPASFSTGKSSVGGVNGLYGLFADVIREAAKERGVLPREMQSIVWESVRGLMTEGAKTDKAKAQSLQLWERFADRKISLPELQRQMFGLFNGIDFPEWTGQKLRVADVNGTITSTVGSSEGVAAPGVRSGSVDGQRESTRGAGRTTVRSRGGDAAGAGRRRPARRAADEELKFAPRTTLRGFGYERDGATADELRDARAAFDERRELQTPTAKVPSLPLRAGELRLLKNVNDEPVRMEPNDEPSRTSVLIAPDGTAYLSGKVSDEASDDESVMVPVTWFGGAERGRGDWTASGVAEKAFGGRGTVGPRAGKRAAAPATGRSEAGGELRRSYGLSLTPEELARSIARETIRRGEELPPLADPASTGLVPPQSVEAAAVTASSQPAPAAAGESTFQDDAPERRSQVDEGSAGAVAPSEMGEAAPVEEPAGATQAPRRSRRAGRARERQEQVQTATVFDDAPIGQPVEQPQQDEPVVGQPAEPAVDAPRDAGFGANVPVPPVKVGNANLNNPGNTAETRALWDVVDRDRAVRGGQVIGREEAETKARQLLQDDYDGTRAELERKLSQGVMLEPWENRAMVNIINDLFMQTLNPRLSEDERREALHDGRELGFAYREMRGNLARSMGSVVGLGMTAKEQVILLMLQLPVIEARRRARIDQELRGYLSQVSAGPLQSQYLQTFFGARREQGSEYDMRNAPPVNERGQLISERRLQQLIERKRADEELDFERQERARKALEKAGYDALVIEDPDALLDPLHGHIIRNIISSAKATWTDKAIELRQSNLLTGVTTHVVNTTGNAAMMVVNGPVQRLVEGMVADSLRATMPQKDLEALPMTREIVPFMMGGIRAIPEAVRNFLEAIRTEGPIFEMNLKRAGAQFGAYTQKLDTQDGVKVAGVKGRAARFFSFTMLQAIDEMFKTIAGNMEASALAWRVAWREGLRGDALQRRMDELMADKTSPIWTEALYFGREITLQDTGGEVAQESSRLLNAMGEMLDRMTEWMVLPLGTIAQGLGVKGASRDQNIALPVGLLLFPFRRVPLRLTAQALRRSPMASLSMVKNKVRGNYDGDERLLVRDIADGFIAFGLFMMLLEVLDDEDDELPVITGSRPISRGEAGAEYRTAPPMSVRIGDGYYNYGRIEPLGTSMAVAIDAIDQYRRTGASDALATGTASLVGMLEDKTFLRSIGDLITIMREYRGGNVSEGEAAARFLRNLYVTPWVPNLIRQTARESAVEYQLPRSIVEDGYPAFMTDGMLDSKGEPIATGLTGVAPAIKRDLWGRPIRRGQGEDGFGSDLLMRLLTPMRHMRDVKDISPIDMALVTANERIRRNELVDVDAYFPTLPTRNFTVTVFEDGEEVKEKRRMTSPQYDDFVRDAGQAAHAGLLRLLAPEVREAYDFSFTPDSDIRNLESLADEVEYAVSKKMDKRDDWSGEFNFEDPGAAELAAIKAAKDAAYRLVRKELADRVTGQ